MSESGSVLSRAGIVNPKMMEGGVVYHKTIVAFFISLGETVSVRSSCVKKRGNNDVESEADKIFCCFRIQDYAPGRCSLASQEVIKVSCDGEKEKSGERIPRLT